MVSRAAAEAAAAAAAASVCEQRRAAIGGERERERERWPADGERKVEEGGIIEGGHRREREMRKVSWGAGARVGGCRAIQYVLEQGWCACMAGRTGVPCGGADMLWLE